MDAYNKILATAACNKAKVALEKALDSLAAKESNQAPFANGLRITISKNITNCAAYFSPYDKNIYFNDCYKDDIDTIKHELNHKYIDKKLGFAPSWFH